MPTAAYGAAVVPAVRDGSVRALAARTTPAAALAQLTAADDSYGRLITA